MCPEELAVADDAEALPAEEIEPGDFDGSDGDSAYGAPSVASLTETLNSEIAKGVSEYGRTYAAYGNEEYGLPIDEAELDRIDMSHAKYKMLLEKKLCLAPISDHPQRILDLGTGTGMAIRSFVLSDINGAAQVSGPWIWLRSIHRQRCVSKMPDPERRSGLQEQVYGVDIAPTQPQWVLPNCRFEIDDIEMLWTWRKESFDLIYARDLLLSIRDWPKLVHQCYEHVKPGGYVELHCVYPKLFCDDESTPYDSGLMEFSRTALKASAAMGTPLAACVEYKSYLEAAGFENVVETRFKLPSAPWPRDPRLKLIGAFELHNLLNGLSAMSLRMFSRAFGWTREQTEVFLVKVRKDLKDLRHHSYYEFIVVHGRKPQSARE
ncbi:S-adenosyl-L-methionine-dependent methyltransferase-21 [Coleophoma cylindrospora]|uniref:S-adenosyl-L-methionine-dependent methyltransferase-21 n=1 Tax=Coleophoma cylindrospora TaxID=1849047 RepID=A0A3D8S1Q7_9HELO|nr:S-adenosyl-L-methionine-dependent methyltransferase-21 [Coleophoma cylindrospora]